MHVVTAIPVSAPAPRTGSRLRLGFLALTDAAPLVVAQEHGYFARRGLRVELSREVGWATIRDKVIYGELDAAHAPAPMLWAAQLGLDCAPADVCTGFIFNLHGAAITLSTRLWAAGVRDQSTLRETALRRRGENKLTFGIMFPYSMHHVLLRQWLRAAHLDPERDVRIAVVPPAQMLRNLAGGTLDGYCAGEPWNSLAVQMGEGWCPVWSAALAPGHVEQVLMVRTAFAERRAAEHGRLISALAEAAAWCDAPDHRAELATLLSAPSWLDLPTNVVAPTLLGQFPCRADHTESVPDFHVFSRGDANAPTLDRAVLLQNELVAAGVLSRALLSPGLPLRLFREDVYREALVHSDSSKTAATASSFGAVFTRA
jgi:ABC-type nitrate/sulfonate/bicarbonate transport system substrate-binding protein